MSIKAFEFWVRSPRYCLLVSVAACSSLQPCRIKNTVDFFFCANFISFAPVFTKQRRTHTTQSFSTMLLKSGKQAFISPLMQDGKVACFRSCFQCTRLHQFESCSMPLAIFGSIAAVDTSVLETRILDLHV
jgi:hypothetical protein